MAPTLPLLRKVRCPPRRSEEHTSELQSQSNLVCRLLLVKKKKSMNCIDRQISYAVSCYKNILPRHRTNALLVHPFLYAWHSNTPSPTCDEVRLRSVTACG